MPQRRRRRKQDADLVKHAIAAVLAALVAVWAWPRPSSTTDGRPNPGATNLYRVVLEDPPWRPGGELDPAHPAVSSWLRGQTLLHRVRGRVEVLELGVDGLSLRPCLYSTAWLTQPAVKVQRDGRFDAVMLFDPDYDRPLLARFEVLREGEVVATYDLVIPARHHYAGGAS